MTDFDPSDFMTVSGCERLHTERWKIEDRDRANILDKIEKIEQALEGQTGLVAKLAVLMESFNTVRSIVYGAVGVIALSFIGMLIAIVGWKVK